jgi:hypothetical protein
MMTDEQMAAIRAKESPEVQALRDKQAQLRTVLAAIHDVPEHHWPDSLRRALHLCCAQDRHVAWDMWVANVAKRYEDA